MSNWTIRICQSFSCQNHLSEDLFKHAEKLSANTENITIEKRSCMAKCDTAPNLQVINEKNGETEEYNEVDYNKIEKIIKSLI